ncbi:MAG: hypothetical protein LBK27_02830 [Treponema sp.]|nr:hypothetical protein [Treponema sp.]
MKKKYMTLLFSALGMVFFAASCTGFFSTSLAPWAARNPVSLIPPVTVDNVAELISYSEGDPDMSYAVLQNIKDAMEGAGADEASILQAAALQAAANASNLGPVLIGQIANIAEITEILDDPEGVANLVTQTLNELTNLEDTSAILAGVLPDPGDATAFEAFVNQAKPDDLAVAAAVLLAAEAKGNSDDFFTDFNPEEPSNSDAAKLAVALAQAAIGKYEDAGSNSRLKDILNGLNLIPAPPGP